MQATKKWFSFTENEDFKDAEPPFFDITLKPFKKLLEDNYAAI